MKTFNKRGDTGQTSLLYGARVAKSDPHCEAYGAVDEASSALGLACCLASPRVAPILRSIQEELLVVGAELAVPSVERVASLKKRVTAQTADRLEGLIDSFEQETEVPRSFVLPGGSAGAAALDLARAITRRAEREAVRLREQKLLSNPEVLKYLNRLADLLFILARYEEGRQPRG